MVRAAESQSKKNRDFGMQNDRTARPVRKRRDAVTTREEILEAACRRVAEYGPDGLRLADIARDVGVTHALILHHFGSRDGLIMALINKVAKDLVEQVVRKLPTIGQAPRDQAPKVNAVFEVLADQRYGKLVAWALQERPSEVAQTVHGFVDRMIDAAIVYQRNRAGGVPDAAWELNLTRWVRLVCMAAMGESVARLIAPQREGDDDQAYRLWLSNMMADSTGI